jgi:hypothetical protein
MSYLSSPAHHDPKHHVRLVYVIVGSLILILILIAAFVITRTTGGNTPDQTTNAPAAAGQPAPGTNACTRIPNLQSIVHTAVVDHALGTFTSALQPVEGDPNQCGIDVAIPNRDSAGGTFKGSLSVHTMVPRSYSDASDLSGTNGWVTGNPNNQTIMIAGCPRGNNTVDGAILRAPLDTSSSRAMNFTLATIVQEVAGKLAHSSL